MSKGYGGQRRPRGSFAPEFAHLNDDILSARWAREQKLSKRDRSLITVSALMASGILNSSLKYHISMPRKTALLKRKWQRRLPILPLRRLAEGLAAFNMVKEIYSEDK